LKRSVFFSERTDLTAILKRFSATSFQKTTSRCLAAARLLDASADVVGGRDGQRRRRDVPPGQAVGGRRRRRNGRHRRRVDVRRAGVGARRDDHRPPRERAHVGQGVVGDMQRPRAGAARAVEARQLADRIREHGRIAEQRPRRRVEDRRPGTRIRRGVEGSSP